MKLRPYKKEDAEKIVSWIHDEVSFRKWCADRFEKYPITAEDMNYKYIDCNGDCDGSGIFFPLTATVGDEIVGHLFLRYLDEEKTLVRIGFVIIDDTKRGMGYGRQMIELAVQYAKDKLNAKRITLGVFENNPSAYKCYKAAGFTEDLSRGPRNFETLGEIWKCLEMVFTR
ncbi:MAG: GNAT family N-acetyltransferase [Eubacterium sp.]|nr:GNAT family N-acetyltransferase [Eubacterium sp.]